LSQEERIRSRWWYLLPIFFQIIGGVIAYFILRNDDPKKAKNCLWLGIALTAIKIGFFVIFISICTSIGSCAEFHDEFMTGIRQGMMEQGMMGSEMTGGMMEGDEAKIRELIFAYQNMLNNEEIEKIPTLYSEQAIFMPPDVPAINGVEEIGLTYEYLFSQFDFELEFDIKQVVISENFAYVLSNSEGTITLESNETEETSKNQEIFILIKEGDNWKISRYMFNSSS